ncbi:MAG: class I SAM-dependent methyltransferase [Candidatus Nomurabacteria bacterium]|nr:MAG: class I SAM-dependent methyltransferase [Candidatus Nomurabacteria bacterium]
MAIKPNFTRKKKRKQHGATFWDSEYSKPEHLKLSTKPSADLEKFTRWLDRRNRMDILGPEASVLDVGCGNGRNLIYLSQTFGCKGIGYDVSAAAISQAVAASKGLPLSYKARSIAGALEIEPESQDLALDMMTSHFLNQAERLTLRDEIHRSLKPGGYLFMKTFLKDDDLHTRRLLKDHAATEEGTYIHPVMGVAEFVYSEEELLNFLSEKFIVHKIYRSHKHAFRGRARKRRTITVYAEKDPYQK